MTTPIPTPTRRHRAGRVLRLLVLTLVLVGGTVSLLTAGAAAQTNNTTALNDTAPYYDNQTALENQSSWYPNGSTVSLDVLGQMSTRLGTYVIGTGDQIPGGTTYAGTVITGLVMVGIFLGSLALTSIGSSGGIVVAATVGYGMTSLGLAPPWLKIVLLFVIGLVAAIAAVRVTN